MNIEDDIKALSNHETFARFISIIHALREETIAEMHNADFDKLQQVSQSRSMHYNTVVVICLRIPCVLVLNFPNLPFVILGHK